MRLIIPAEVEAKLHAYVRSVNTEIAGMGKAKVSDQGDIMLLDVAIYDQEVTGGTADLSSEALAKFQMELIQKNESPKDWIVWWHSHADMAAFFSGRDTATIDSSDEFNHLVSLVVNRRRQREARLDLYHPFRFTKTDLPIIVGSAEEIIPQEIRDEVAAKVHIKTWTGFQGTGKQYLGFGKKENYKENDFSGKGFPARHGSDSDARRSGTLEMPGRLITDGENEEEEVIPLSTEDIHVMLQAGKERMKEMELNGMSEYLEYDELKTDMANLEYELIVRNDDDVAERLTDHIEGRP